MRINKAIAMTGYCSRRRADEMIAQGRVMLNGELVNQPGVQVAEDDEICVDGERIIGQPLRYYVYNKPMYKLSSHGDPHHDRVIYEDLPKNEGLFSVGRLDFLSEGLMLITNDGEWAQKQAHPRYEHAKIYLVLVENPLSDSDLKRMCSGIIRKGIAYRAKSVQMANVSDFPSLPLCVSAPEVFYDSRHALYRVVLEEGKKREIRELFSAVGHPVIRLVRWEQAGVTPEGLAPGEYRALRAEEIGR